MVGDTRNQTRCAQCGQPVTQTLDAPRAGIPITINTTPITPQRARELLHTGQPLTIRRGGEHHPGTLHHLDHPRHGDTWHTRHHHPQQGTLL